VIQRQYVGNEEAVVATVVCQRVTYCNPVYVHHTGSDGLERIDPDEVRFVLG
jgi:hypothetical protein